MNLFTHFKKKGKDLHDKIKKNLNKNQEKEILNIPEMEESTNNKEVVLVEISPLSVVKATLSIVGILLLLFIFYKISDILILFFIALFFSATLDPAVDFFEKYKIPRSLGVIILYFLLVVFIIFFFGSVIPILFDQIAKIISTISEFIVGFFKDVQSGKHAIPYLGENGNNLISESFKSINLEQIFKNILEDFSIYIKGLKDIATNSLSAVGGAVGAGASIAGAIGKFLFDLILVFFLAFFMVANRDNLNQFFRSLFPPRYSKYIEGKTHDIQKQIGAWIRGQFALMTIMFFISLFGLLIIGMGDYALTLAMIMGVGELLPYVGPLIFFLVGLPIALNISLFMVVKFLILYFLIQFIEGNFLVPLVMKKAVGLSPIVVLIVILIGFQFLGIIGAIIAVPLTTAIYIFIKDFILFQQNKTDK